MVELIEQSQLAVDEMIDVLGRASIERKLDRIYRVVNRRRSPKAAQETVAHRAPRRAGENGCGKAARSASLEIPSGFPLSHSHDGGGPSSVLAQEVPNQTPSATL